MTDAIISPSILSADFARLGEDVEKVLAAGADHIHFDVMDNHYVPNLSFGPCVCKALRDFGITAHIDVHLMVKPVDRMIEDFATAGANHITIHPEATEHLDRSIQLIKQHNMTCGIALNPATALTHLKYVLDKIDLILIMTVNPGFGGQKFMSPLLHKIREANVLRKVNHSKIQLQVDGGINIDNIAAIAQAGADNFVAGSAIFNSENYASTIQAMRKEIANVVVNPDG